MVVCLFSSGCICPQPQNLASGTNPGCYMRPTLPRMRLANMPTFGAKLTPSISPQPWRDLGSREYGWDPNRKNEGMICTCHFACMENRFYIVVVRLKSPLQFPQFWKTLMRSSSWFHSQVLFFLGYFHMNIESSLQRYPANLRSLERTPLGTHPRHTPDVAGPPGPENWAENGWSIGFGKRMVCLPGVSPTLLRDDLFWYCIYVDWF